jgi:RHS repeat-associated protein
MCVRIRRYSLRSMLLVLVGSTFLLSLGLRHAVAQSVPGIQMFSTNENGVDLATGNINIDNIQFRSKPGKIPFWSHSFGTSGMEIQYAPGAELNPMFGLGIGVVTPATAVQSFSVSVGPEKPCYIAGNPPEYQIVLITYEHLGSMVDQTGAGHLIRVNPTGAMLGSGPAGSSCGSSGTASGLASDGSGYSFVITNGELAVYDKSGNQWNGSCNVSGACSLVNKITDPDGATTFLQYNDGIQEEIDSLNTEVFTATAPLSYLDANNNTQEFMVGTSPMNLATNFKCVTTGGLQLPGDYLGAGPFNMMTSITTPTGAYGFTYEETNGMSGYYTGRIQTITLPSGGSISYAYSLGNTGINGFNCNYLTVPTLQVTVNDNNGNQGIYAYVSSLSTVDSGGFPPLPNFTVTKTDPANNQTVFAFSGEFQTEKQVYQGSASGTPLVTTITCYNGFANGQNSSPAACISPSVPTALPITQTDVYTSFNGGAFSLIETVYDTYGNVTDVKNYDYGAESIPPSSSVTPLSEVQTIYNTESSCVNGTVSTGIVDLPCTITTLSSGSMASQVSYTYNSTGHPLATTRWVGGSSSPLTSTATYNGNGTVMTTHDVNGTLSTYAYNETGNCVPPVLPILPTSVTVKGTGLPSGGLTTSTQWDCNGGVATSVTGPNVGQTTTTNYLVNGVADPLYRPLSTVDPSGATTNYKYPTPTQFESFMNFNGSVSTTDVLTTTDGLGRPIFSQKRQAQGSSTFDITQTTYGWGSASGCTQQPPFTTGACTTTSVPYSGTAGKAAPSGTGITTTQYDALGRPLSIVDGAGGSTAYTYSQNDVLQKVGPNQIFQKQLEYDALGRLTSVCEITSAANGGVACGQSNPQTGYWTRYQYDGLGNLLGVCENTTQPLSVNCIQNPSGGQQIRTFTYDGLSRLTSEMNPESGTTTYQYDTNATCGTSKGDLVSRVDANGNTTCYAYDGLHRATSQTYSGPNATTNRYFRYDAATVNGQAMASVAGRLAEGYTASSSGGTKITDEGFSYTARGDLANFYESTPNSAGYYSVPMTNWANGQLETFGPFLSEGQIGVTPDGEGRPYTITGASSSVPSIAYNAASLPTKIMTSCADGTTCYPINYTYNQYTLRMKSYAAALATGTVSGTLNWNPNGTLQQLVIADPKNAADAQTCTYTADALDRLSSVSCNSGAVWGQTFSYDAFGNLTKSVPSGATGIQWQPGYNPSTNRYTLGGTSYDANGNLLDDTFATYTWDAEGKPLSTDYFNEIGGETFSFTYDAFGHKVEFSANGSYQNSFINVGNIKLQAIGQTAYYSEFPLPGGSVLSQNGGATGGFLADWLGTKRAFFSYTGGTEGNSEAYAPFGEIYADAGGGHPFGFAGEDNSDSSLSNTTYWFPERHYRSSQGRWISPDPAGLSAVDPSNPQSWNRYAYVVNNPLSLTDSTGLEPCSNTADGEFVCQASGGDDGGQPAANDLGSPDLDFSDPWSLQDAANGATTSWWQKLNNFFDPCGGNPNCTTVYGTTDPGPATNLLNLDTCIGNNAKNYSIGGLVNLAFNTNVPGSGFLDNSVTSTAQFLTGQSGLLATTWGAGKLGFKGAAAASPAIMTNGPNSLTTITPKLGSPQPVLGNGTNHIPSFVGKAGKALGAAKGVLDVALSGALVADCALGQVH